jgi:aminotransferase
MDLHQCDHYTRRPGLAALCQRVAQRLAERGIAADPTSGVIITGSVQEARFVALRSLAPGKTVYVPQPAPATYRPGIEFAGAMVQPFDPDQTLPSASGDLLIVPNPHPATGQLVEPAALHRLAAWAAASNMTIVADETLAPLLAPDLPTWPELASRTVILGSFATPGLAAWQVSWIAGSVSLVTTVRDMKQAMTICTPAPSQYAALAGLADLLGPSGVGRKEE